jgi:glycosyltransferase involved in cell wall biosynthesis
MKPENNGPVVDIVLPVHNEEAQLTRSVITLRQHLLENFPFSWRITIANHASTDRTGQIARELEQNYPGQVTALHLDRKGRGRALRYAWACSDAPVVAYMDVDLSTRLESLLPLVAPLVSGHSLIATGTSLARGTRIKRQFKREVTSRGYNLLIRLIFGPVFSDAQCGLKAVRKELVMPILAQVENNEWFFDSEFLLLAVRNRIRIFEVPVDWIEDRDTRVKINKTVIQGLKGLWRMRLKFWLGGGLLQQVPASHALTTLQKAEIAATRPGQELDRAA